MQEFAISKEYGLMWYKTIKGDFYQRIWKTKTDIRRN
jgi:hypothetical protein